MVRRSKILVLAVSLFSLVFMCASCAMAHDFWANASVKDGIINADIGYGHDFPTPEPIPEERVKIFAPMQLVTDKETVTLEQSGENYAYKGKFPYEKGTFLVVGTYKPTFWSKGPDGWKMVPRDEYKDSTYAQEAAMYSKLILNVGGAEDDEMAKKAVGQRLEIIPQVNPAKVKAGGKFPVQVVSDGQPLKNAQLTAVFAGFNEKDVYHKAFMGKTDANGMINIIPLKAGYWFAQVSHKIVNEDKTKADEVELLSGLTFNIPE